MLRSVFILVAVVTTALSTGAAHAVVAEPDRDLLLVLSSRPETVSGGNALVEYRAPREDIRWSAVLNGNDVTISFRRVESGEWIALLTGLREGKNSLTIKESGAFKAKIDLFNHPLSGPIFSGLHQEPFICQTVPNGLGPPLDAQCSAETVVQYYYKPAHSAPVDGTWIKALEALAGRPVDVPPGFRRYDLDSPPTDVASTVMADGRTVPYVVRRELGVVNRSVYDIRFLHEPRQSLPNPWSRENSDWNGRLIYELGGGCGGGHRQGTLIAPASHEAVLAQGYAVVTSTLNIFGNSCNDVLSAETVSMVKEHFIKEYGVPVHTIGWGGSGGAMQQYLIAQNYPGLLDGIIPYVSFPDTVTYVSYISDCSLLVHAFDGAKLPWTDEQKTAVTGFATWHVCPSGVSEPFAISPRNCDTALPQGEIYNPKDRPKGVRCDIYDNEVNVFGRNPQTGFAARPLDNVGVQYGLVAFNSGQIDAGQFIGLNERAGGFDADGHIVAQRTTASPEVIERAYRSGVVLTGGGGLANIPIIDWRWYSDDQGDNHDRFRSLETRARLIAANGTAANQVILVDPPSNTFVMVISDVSDPSPESSNIARRERELVRAMDHWLDNIAADQGQGPQSAKVVRDKPAELVDACWTPAGRYVVDAIPDGDSGRCAKMYPPHGDPRTAAGGPLTDDVLKCSLKPISTGDYAQSLSAEQFRRLRDVFPTGVCDYTRPGVGQERTQGVWHHY
jgi:hypothetical protein